EQLNNTLGNKQGLAYNAINLGISYQKIGLPQEAMKNLQTGLQIGSELGDKTTLLKAYDAYSNVYLEQKNYLKALESKDKYLETYKSLYNWEQSEQVNTIRGKYESEKQYLEQKLLEEKTAKLELDNYYSNLHLFHLTIGAGICVFLLIIISLLLYFNSIKAKKNKEAAQILRLKNSSLQEANLTKEKFLSIIGHDLKNPFNSVLGLSNLIIDQWKQLDDEEKFTISNEINGSSQTIYELLDNLLLWSRTQTSKTETHPELFDLNENIQNIYEIFRNQANFKSITVRLDISGKKMVFADMNMIATVIRNLLSNALKFTHQGGKITISTKSKVDMVEFSISDNGKGILPDDLKKIFESKGIHNSKGTANESGSGLGLLLAKDFIQQNNGIIWVESKPNKGSQFTFTLPTS
ncbi:MAG: tetratricopeptide repeat-containing sensor histidine kinase, partial [Bacteroidales bacterium]|nr:tetratricopeptide repeat-containing sensor histidine kinase [Bacteroidales bacterium]